MVNNPKGVGGFKPGQSGNPGGRKAKDPDDKLRDIIVAECTPEDMKQIARKAVEMAKRGDSAARTWVTNYVIGPPKQEHDVNVAGKIILWDVPIPTSSSRN